jgi:hypothetical protein
MAVSNEGMRTTSKTAAASGTFDDADDVNDLFSFRQ